MLFGMAQLMLAALERELQLRRAQRRVLLERRMPTTLPPAPHRAARVAPVAVAGAALGAATPVAFALNGVVQSPTAAGWVYLLVVLPVALHWGRLLGLLTAALAAALVLMLLVEPRLSFAVADGRDAGRLALSLAGMVVAVLLVRARDGRTRALPSRGPRGSLPTTPVPAPTDPARNGHHGRVHLSDHGAVGRPPRPIRGAPLDTWSRLTGPPDAPLLVIDLRRRPPERERRAASGGLALPAWVCASLLGIVAGALLAKHGQYWAQTTWHPAAATGGVIVVASASLTALAATRSLRRRAGEAPPRGLERLLGVLSIALVTLVGWAALAIIFVAGWAWPPARAG
jgi:hypothetical protein